MLIEDENSDDEFFKYKITARDYEILQKAKIQEGMNQQQQVFG